MSDLVNYGKVMKPDSLSTNTRFVGELVSNLKTYNNVVRFKSLILDIRDMALSDSLDMSVLLNNYKGSVIDFDADQLLSLIGALYLGYGDQCTVQSFLSSLDVVLDSIKVVEVSLAIDPDEGMVDKIFMWIHNNIGKDIVFNTKVDSEMLGGIKLSYEGYYLDLSLEKKLSEVFESFEVGLI